MESDTWKRERNSVVQTTSSARKSTSLARSTAEPSPVAQGQREASRPRMRVPRLVLQPLPQPRKNLRLARKRLKLTGVRRPAGMKRRSQDLTRAKMSFLPTGEQDILAPWSNCLVEWLALG